MLHNQQLPEKRQLPDLHGRLDVHSIFYTIQGEGPFCGTPAVFIRLAGCNLQCPMCDTDYTTGRRMMTAEDIVRSVLFAQTESNSCADFNEFSKNEYTYFQGLVVITGGEPFRQDLSELCDRLIARNCYIQIETNGTLSPTVPERLLTPTVHLSNRIGVYIVCSPKTGRVHLDTHKWACCYKYVMCADSVNKSDGLPTHALHHTLGTLRVARPASYRPIYLQPMDEQNPVANARHLQACINSCMKYGYILQLQIHKILRME